MGTQSPEAFFSERRPGLGEYAGRGAELLLALGLTAAALPMMMIPLIGWGIGGGMLISAGALGLNALRKRR